MLPKNLLKKDRLKYFVVGGGALLILLLFVYWQYSRISCTNKAASFIEEAQSIAQAKSVFELGFDICMKRKGF